MVALGADEMRRLAQAREVAAVRNMTGRLIVAAPNAIARGAARAFDDLDPLVKTLSQALATRGLPTGQMKAANQRIAKNAQKAMVGGYYATLPLRSPGYRPHQRHTKALERALADEAMTANTTDRVISFVNQRFLDGKAEHWYRINYGVAGHLTQGPGREARTFVVLVNKQNIATLRDPNPKRQGGIYLPHRFRWDGVMFTPLTKVKPRSSISKVTGSRAAHFVDLGLETVAEEAGPVYEKILREHVQTNRGKRVMARRKIVVPDMRMIPNGNWTVSIHT